MVLKHTTTLFSSFWAFNFDFYDLKVWCNIGMKIRLLNKNTNSTKDYGKHNLVL